MPSCLYCGAEIEFRYLPGDSRPTPIHIHGGRCSAVDDAYVNRRDRRDSEPRSTIVRDFCRPTLCPKCNAEVFFIQHNGGSVWVDALGWPWPRHACFANEKLPDWLLYMQKNTKQVESRQSYLGLVVAAKRLPATDREASKILIATEAPNGERRCFSVVASSSADYHIGRVVLVQCNSNSVVSSTFDMYAVVHDQVSPVLVGLTEGWFTEKNA